MKRKILLMVVVMATFGSSIWYFNFWRGNSEVSQIINGKKVTIKKPDKNTPGISPVREVKTEKDLERVQADINYAISLIPVEYRQ